MNNKKKQKTPRNKSEKNFLRELRKNKTRGSKITYESQRIPYQTPHNYVPDFVIEFPSDGHIRYIEYKGYFRPQDRVKMRYVLRQNPDLDIRMYFPKDQKVYKNGKMMYSDWCKKYGCKYAIGKFPKSWLRRNG